MQRQSESSLWISCDCSKFVMDPVYPPSGPVAPELFGRTCGFQFELRSTAWLPSHLLGVHQK
jgi:hypothetical protein